MDVHGHGRVQGIRINNQAKRHLDGESSKCFLSARDMSNESFFFFSPPTEICPELPPVDNSIFVAKEGEGQILGTYLCNNGYHLVGEKTLFCNASKGWNASAPECRCKFDLSATLFTLSSLCILSYRTSSRPW